MEEKSEGPLPPYRSVSQVTQYLPEMGGCPYRYKLSRRDPRAWRRPAAWLAQGLGVHATIEDDEKSGRTMTLTEAQDRFTDHYVNEIEKAAEVTPNFEYWFGSGPRYPGPIDIPRRHNIGREQIERWFNFVDMNPDHVPDEINGELAVELPFEARIGDVEVRGLIDQVVKGVPIDVKTGSRNGDPFQLVTYAFVLHTLFDIPITSGAFWYGKNGKLVSHHIGETWSLDQLADVYGQADEGIEEERFDPDPSPSKCRMCDVNLACEFSQA